MPSWEQTLPLLPPVIASFVSAAALLLGAMIARWSARDARRQSRFEFLHRSWQEDKREQSKIILEIISLIPKGRAQTKDERDAFLVSVRKMEVTLIINGIRNDTILETITNTPDNNASDLNEWRIMFSNNVDAFYKVANADKMAIIRTQSDDM